jgi:hypothetical protein
MHVQFDPERFNGDFLQHGVVSLSFDYNYAGCASLRHNQKRHLFSIALMNWGQLSGFSEYALAPER